MIAVTALVHLKSSKRSPANVSNQLQRTYQRRFPIQGGYCFRFEWRRLPAALRRMQRFSVAVVDPFGSGGIFSENTRRRATPAAAERSPGRYVCLLNV